MALIQRLFDRLLILWPVWLLLSLTHHHKNKPRRCHTSKHEPQMYLFYLFLFFFRNRPGCHGSCLRSLIGHISAWRVTTCRPYLLPALAEMLFYLLQKRKEPIPLTLDSRLVPGLGLDLQGLSGVINWIRLVGDQLSSPPHLHPSPWPDKGKPPQWTESPLSPTSPPRYSPVLTDCPVSAPLLADAAHQIGAALSPAPASPAASDPHRSESDPKRLSET